MLGVKRMLRIGTCGGLQPDLDARRPDRGRSPRCRPTRPRSTSPARSTRPTADWGLVHSAVHAAKELGKPVRVGPIVSSDVFYNSDEGQYQRWSDRGILAVEMEAAVLFTLGALRKVQAGCLLTVSDVVVEGEFVRITRRGDEGGRRPDDRAGAGSGDGRPLTMAADVVFVVNPASANGSTRRRWPEIARRAAELGLAGETLFSERPGPRRRPGAAGRGGGRAPRRRGRRRRDRQRGRERPPARARGRRPELAMIPRGTGTDFARSFRIPTELDGALARGAPDGATRTVDVGRAAFTALGRLGRPRRTSPTSRGAGISGAVAARANTSLEGARRQGVVLLGDDRRSSPAGRTSEYEVDVDGERALGPHVEVIAANGD